MNEAETRAELIDFGRLENCFLGAASIAVL